MDRLIYRPNSPLLTPLHADILCEALEQTGLIDDLSGDFWSVFAPTNEAFESLPEGVLSALVMDLPALTDLLLFHAAPGVGLNVTTLNCDDELEMANGDSSTTLCIDNGLGGIKAQVGEGNNVETLPLISASVEACNGYVNVIERVMMYVLKMAMIFALT